MTKQLDIYSHLQSKIVGRRPGPTPDYSSRLGADVAVAYSEEPINDKLIRRYSATAYAQIAVARDHAKNTELQVLNEQKAVRMLGRIIFRDLIEELEDLLTWVDQEGMDNALRDKVIRLLALTKGGG